MSETVFMIEVATAVLSGELRRRDMKEPGERSRADCCVAGRSGARYGSFGQGICDIGGVEGKCPARLCDKLAIGYVAEEKSFRRFIRLSTADNEFAHSRSPSTNPNTQFFKMSAFAMNLVENSGSKI